MHFANAYLFSKRYCILIGDIVILKYYQVPKDLTVRLWVNNVNQANASRMRLYAMCRDLELRK